MKPDPAWKQEFPINWSDDDRVTRRGFARSLVWMGCAALAAKAALAARGPSPEAQDGPALRIADRHDLEVGGVKVFGYPDATHPCLLVRLSAAEFVAFAQECTHLACPVQYEAQTQRLHCPCHEGYFDARTGAVISGPPPRPLPVVRLERRGDELWATGWL